MSQSARPKVIPQAPQKEHHPEPPAPDVLLDHEGAPILDERGDPLLAG